jgi:hypothetical protein
MVHDYAYEIFLILSNLSSVLIIILVFGLPIKLMITYSRVWIGKFSSFRLGHKATGNNIKNDLRGNQVRPRPKVVDGRFMTNLDYSNRKQETRMEIDVR